ncbi:MAG TPA: NADH:flavin oxidoreductase/NADH oxidase [Mycobacteriales bacterium]|nr:NADH:flavin oxidoreductase/NADH oxidase [Mycobacteriales bacterium]
MTDLFEPLRLRGATARNRIWVSSMCQYSASDGIPDDWHLVHLGGFATGGAGLVMTEATAVTPEGRISPADTGIWNDAQAATWRRITDFIHRQGALTGMQLAHSGRKGSTPPPWLGPYRTLGPEENGWQPVGPTTDPFERLAAPRALTVAELRALTGSFAEAARRSVDAGFDLVELHYAHGYLAHQIYSPLSNTRTDGYGGDFEGRTRWLLETAEAVRAAMPDSVPLFVRLSTTDWVPGGWEVPDSVRLASLLRAAGVDLIDCSSGGVVAKAEIPVGPGYQVGACREVRHGAGIPTAAVGMITTPVQAHQVVTSGAADAVLLGREMLRNPRWPLYAAAELGAEVAWPVQYERARRR